MADIFISYKREDKHLAEDVIHRLKEAGLSVWYDERITPHASWDETIEREIAAAKAVVVLWTERSVTSQWVRTEADYAAEHGKMVPVRLDGCALPLAYRRMQTADLSNWDGNASHREWQKALGWVKSLVAGGAGVPGIGPDRAGGGSSAGKKSGGWRLPLAALVLLGGAGGAWVSGAMTGLGVPSLEQVLGGAEDTPATTATVAAAEEARTEDAPVEEMAVAAVVDVEPEPPTCFKLEVRAAETEADGALWDDPFSEPDLLIYYTLEDRPATNKDSNHLCRDDEFFCETREFANPDAKDRVNLLIYDDDIFPNRDDGIGSGSCEIPSRDCVVELATVNVLAC